MSAVNLTRLAKQYEPSVLRRCAVAKEPIAFFGFAGAAAAGLVQQGYLTVAEQRQPLGTRYFEVTDAGLVALKEQS